MPFRFLQVKTSFFLFLFLTLLLIFHPFSNFILQTSDTLFISLLLLYFYLFQSFTLRFSSLYFSLFLYLAIFTCFSFFSHFRLFLSAVTIATFLVLVQQISTHHKASRPFPALSSLAPLSFKTHGTFSKHTSFSNVTMFASVVLTYPTVTRQLRSSP